MAEDRVRFSALCAQLGFKAPTSGQAGRVEEALKAVSHYRLSSNSSPQLCFRGPAHGDLGKRRGVKGLFSKA